MTIRDIAWLAGLFEGEGCIWNKRNSRGHHFVMQINMTDEDVVRHARAVTGTGVMSGPRVLKSGKHAWTWTVKRSEDVAGLALTLFTFLGRRRRDRIIAALRNWRTSPPPYRLRHHCKYGHPFAGDNLAIRDGRRRCRACINRRMREHRARKAAA